MNDFFVVGGTMQPDAPSYIEREADRELFEHLLAGDFCYVLTPRQMGKSSLMARTAKRLREHGVHTAIVDLTQIGTEKEIQSADRWYYGISHRITRELALNVKLNEWWNDRQNLPALQRLTEFFNDLVLANTSDRVAIFVDEIDSTISLPFTDDFFAAIRACYNARATEPQYQRLSFVLLGVASPSDLMKETRRTPFNIGHRISLIDFTFKEAKPLAVGLGSNRQKAEQVLRRILHWTGGHPYLTQKRCAAVFERKLEGYDHSEIDRLVDKHFFAPEANRQEHNLNFVRDRLTEDKRRSRHLLRLYRRIYKGEKIIDNPLSVVHTELKLSGLVVPNKNSLLLVRNLIYKRVFTAEWAKQAMPPDWNRRIAISSSVALVLLGFGIWYTQLLPRTHINVLLTASDDYQLAYNSYQSLRKIPGFATRADELLAQFWERHALRAEAQENRDEALLYRLKVQTIKPTEIRKREARLLAEVDYQNLLVTYRHNAPISVVAFSPDGKIVLTGAGDNMVQLWSADRGTPIYQPMQHRSPVDAVAFSPDGKTVLTGSDDGTARLWWAESGEPVGKPMRHENVIRGGVAFNPDGQAVLTGSWDGTARLWRVNNDMPLAHSLRFADRVTTTAFNSNGTIVLTGNNNGTAQLCSVVSGAPLGQPMQHNNVVRAVAFSPDGQTLVTGSDDSTARLWCADSGIPIGQPMQHADRVITVGFSPDGKTVFTGSHDSTVRLWRVDSAQHFSQLIRHQGNVLGMVTVAFSPNGKTLLTGGNDWTAQLWRINSGQPFVHPMRHQGSVTAAAFSPDGKTLLTGSDYGIVQFWQADRGVSVGKPMQHKRVFSVFGDEFPFGGVTAVTFSPDGQTVMAATDWWVHLSSAMSDTSAPIPKVNRMLSGRWTGAYRFLDEVGNQMQVAVRVTGDAIKIDTLRFDVPNAPPIQGDPKALLEEWQRKLALKFDENGKIVPMYSVEAARER
jgi:WD40 repeat protein